jgi:CheY-like chemotaxis protein
MTENLVRNVLLVEDEEALLFGLKKLLEGTGVTVHAARTLEEAKDFLSRHAYKVVITDLRLTGTTIVEGLEVISLAKTLQPGCKIITMTAYAENGTHLRVEELGVDYFLEKPVSLNTLKSILSSIRD